MHISNPEEKSWIQQRIEGRTRASPSPRTARRRSCNKLIEAEGFEKFIDVKYTGTKRFGLDGGESLVPALEQIIKRGGADGRERHRARHGPPRPPQRALPGDGETAPRHLPRIQGRLVHAGRCGRLRRREIPPRRLVRPRVRRQQGSPVADRQPVASGDRQSGGAGQGARQAGPDGPAARSVPKSCRSTRPRQGSAAAAAWRCGLCRPGRCAECFGLSALRGHRVAGSIHFIINNQIGFTTNPRFSRSSPYPPMWRR
jgi:2-oxoglutarate dehydrogenase E1 component